MAQPGCTENISRFGLTQTVDATSKTHPKNQPFMETAVIRNPGLSRFATHIVYQAFGHWSDETGASVKNRGKSYGAINARGRSELSIGGAARLGFRFGPYRKAWFCSAPS
jgi:hypothetical protein